MSVVRNKVAEGHSLNSGMFKIVVLASTLFSIVSPAFGDSVEHESECKSATTKNSVNQIEPSTLKQNYVNLMETFTSMDHDYVELWEMLGPIYYESSCDVQPMHTLYKVRTDVMKKIEEVHVARKRLISVTSTAYVESLDKSRDWNVPSDIYAYHRQLKLSQDHLSTFDEWDHIKPL